MLRDWPLALDFAFPSSCPRLYREKKPEEGSLPPLLFHPSPPASACSEMSLNQAVPAEVSGKI